MDRNSRKTVAEFLNSQASASATRRSFLQRSIATGAAAVPALLIGASAVAADKNQGRSLGGDRNRRRPPPPPPQTLPSLYTNQTAALFKEIRDDEDAHVKFLISALGPDARPKPEFKNIEQPDIHTFAMNSFVLENTGVAAYLAAAPIINSKAYLAAAGSILTIEARHSGFLGPLTQHGLQPFGLSFDQPGTIQGVINNASPFLTGNLNGGPPLTFDTTPSDANDIMILNFALALEYLEMAYYDVNVKKFFGV